MSDAFAVGVGEVLRYEGGYVNDAQDPGGETNFGICKRDHPDLDIKNLTRDAAIAIYRREYWEPAGCGQLPPILAIALFDMAVNQGVGAAVRAMQRALHVREDASIGPVTVAAAARSDLRAVLADFLAERALRYAGLPTFATYGRGWLRHLFALHETCLAVPAA